MLIAFLVTFLLFELDISVHFYDQAGSMAVEIGDVAINDLLAMDFHLSLNPFPQGKRLKSPFLQGGVGVGLGADFHHDFPFNAYSLLIASSGKATLIGLLRSSIKFP